MAAPHGTQEHGRPGEGNWLLRLYDMISIDTDDVLADARGIGIQVRTVEELRAVRTSVLDGLADQYIRNAKLMTSLSGAGLGAGGLMLVGPDLSILAGSLLRLAQRLAVVYGFDFRRSSESVHVWAALGRSLGVEKVTDGAGQVAVRNLPKLLAQGAGKSVSFKALVKAIAGRLGLLVTERGLARALPLVGAGVAAMTNYQIVRELGDKMRTYFRERHITEKVERGSAPGQRSARAGFTADPVPDTSRGPGAPDFEGIGDGVHSAGGRKSRSTPRTKKKSAGKASVPKTRKKTGTKTTRKTRR